jgi:sugar lactone lactonase YvrE
MDDGGGAKIMKFKLATAISAAILLCPGLSWGFVLTSGEILISNHGGNNVQVLDPATGIVSSLVNVPGTPIGLAFDTSFNLYINVNNGIMKFDKNTNALTTLFTGVGQREGLAFDTHSGHLFSVSFGGNRIEEVDLAGNLVRTITIPGTSQLLGISARSGTLVVTDFGAGKTYLSTDGGNTFGLVGSTSPGNTYAPDIDSNGNIFVNDFALGKTVEFVPLGGGLFNKLDFITGLSAPANGLSIGDDGSLTISEFGANAISIWNSDATLRHRFSGVQSPDELVVFAPIRQGGGDGGGGGGIPEPATLVLFGSGFAGLVGFRLLRAYRA